MAAIMFVSSLEFVCELCIECLEVVHEKFSKSLHDVLDELLRSFKKVYKMFTRSV